MKLNDLVKCIENNFNEPITCTKFQPRNPYIEHRLMFQYVNVTIWILVDANNNVIDLTKDLQFKNAFSYTNNLQNKSNSDILYIDVINFIENLLKLDKL